MAHTLGAKPFIRPEDLDGVPFISSHPDTYVGDRVQAMFEDYGVNANIALVSNVAPTLCEFVAEGLGVSLVHPLSVSGLEHRLTVRLFEPEIVYSFQLCRNADSRNAELVEIFSGKLKETAARISERVLGPAREARRRAKAG